MKTPFSPSKPLKRRARRAPHVPSDRLLTADEAAMERGTARSTFWRDVRAGRVPGPYYVGPRMPRWRLSEIVASVEACRTPAKPEGR